MNGSKQGVTSDAGDRNAKSKTPSLSQAHISRNPEEQLKA